MAEFLSEMKTVRLRKTSFTKPAADASGSRRGESAGSTDSNKTVMVGGRSMSTGNAAILKKLGESISRSQSATSSFKMVGDTSWIGSRNSSWSQERSVVLDAAKTGDKRKREVPTQEDSLAHASKRRSSSSSSSLQDPSFADLSRSYPPSRQIVIPRASTITPSLCSDKGQDDSDERLPSTPPAPPNLSMPVRKLFVPPPRTEKEIIDVDMDRHNNRAIAVTPPPIPRASAASSRRPPPSTSDVFAMRPPSSPLPAVPSPRKPRPPARIPRAAPPPPPPPEAEEEEEDELSLSFGTNDAPDLSPGDRPPPSKRKAKAAVLAAHGKPPKSRERGREQAPPPHSRSQSPLPPLQFAQPRRGKEKERERTSAAPSNASTSTSSRGATTSTGTGRTSKNRRRQTLDEEMRSAAAERARSRSSQQDWEREPEPEPEFDYSDLENGILVGVGTRPKNRGFLAHGGAGGAPVFMGAGYVEGVEDERDDGDGDGGDGDYEPPPTGRRRSNR
ncbi:hypothetical protein K438DRAFT_428685 [Mycena galopus ATCC 62051]|nr:hypothetical protein K438DRAFT_428685 [Mycena galopus ATCC 62051]